MDLLKWIVKAAANVGVVLGVALVLVGLWAVVFLSGVFVLEILDFMGSV